ncbi:hypothetical protein FW774_07920 [Pedobacter sp. BS3]|uniref:hypothetical protein n=1 Tax=Pedobacter sp. BS3 TaxID=2567937 RepID=UPI0011F082CC|nr:hypothetical protein [Pedobacter sp. BS3]TZF84893.1 hypothetical protein FW774_07920 [Pedobacter sp. BS3]
MRLIEVTTPALARDFLTMPVPLYKDDPNYIRPLDDDVESVFDPLRNKRYLDGDCIRWILRDDAGQTIGRIAAFVHYETAMSFEQPTGGAGFFECINNREAAFMLFDAAKAWLLNKKMEAMDGPINFGDRDKWWGLLVDGFTEPCYCCNYNPPYYRELFESYGFEVYFKQYTYYMDPMKPLPEALYNRAERIMASGDYHFGHLRLNQLPKYAEDFRQIYNKAWVHHNGVKAMSSDQAQALVNGMKTVIDEKLIWFAYYKKEPVGFFISIPELNQLFVKYVNGKLDLIGKLKLFWRKYLKKCDTAYGIVFGVVPEFQRKGVELAMIGAASRVVQNGRLMPYRHLQMNWIGDFNPRMMRVVEFIGGRIYKTHHTYRYLFNRDLEFKRHPVI